MTIYKKQSPTLLLSLVSIATQAPAQTAFDPVAGDIDALMRDPEGLALAQQLTPATYERLRDYLRTTWDIGVEQVNDWSAQMFVSTFSLSHMERVAALNREVIAPMREADYADYALIQIQRNEAWLPRIETLLQTPETEMVVVASRT